MNRLLIGAFAAVLAAGILAGCRDANGGGAKPADKAEAVGGSPAAGAQPATQAPAVRVNAPNPLHEQPSTVYYEIFVRSFYDSDGDGIGDLNGVTAKLDYLQRLGVGGIWLMPIMPSPSYHGYDVVDYYAVNPPFGTLDDFKKLLAEAHKRGIKVILDLVANHTSVENPWFVDAAKGKETAKRDWYVWAEDRDRTPGDVSAAGGEAWHEKYGGHYLGIFSDRMPDLNYDNPAVRAEMIKVGQYWLKLGADGFRLDAAKHVYEDMQNDGTDPVVKKKNQAWWQEFRKGMDQVKPDAYLVGEVWDSTAKIGPFLDHALNSCFDFDLAQNILSAVKDEDGGNLVFSLRRASDYYGKQSGGAYTDAIFLTNHDQDRVMSALGGQAEHARMAASILLTLPGNPFLYYGEEIGMKGTKPDEHIREPMHWTADAGVGTPAWEASGSTDAAVNAEAEEQDPDSLWTHYRTLIEWRSREPALANGDVAEADFGQKGVLAYERMTDKASVLVVHNLSGQQRQVNVARVESGAFRAVEFADRSGIRLQAGILSLPPYSSAVLKR